MQIVKCSNCYKDMEIPFGQATARITLSKSSRCDKCNKSDTVNKDFSFCCVECMIEFVEREQYGSELQIRA